MDINLELVTREGVKKNFRLPSTVTIIGRRQDCDLCIPLMNISRRHCEINQDQGKLKVRDLGSRNGTFVNGKKISEAPLNHGDNISIGPVKFKVSINKTNSDEQAKKVSAEFLKDTHYPKQGHSKETEIMDSFNQ